MMIPEIIKGGKHVDGRGVLSFVNDFDLKEIKRFYTIEHPDPTVVRAWQGHKVEQKWFFVSAGSFEIRLVKIDDWEFPSKTIKPLKYLLTACNPEILYIPAGYANGFKAAEQYSKLFVFADLTTEESIIDTVRYDKETWGNW